MWDWQSVVCVRESCENRAKVWANDSRKPLQRNGLRGFLSCENRAKIVRKSCGATGAACPEPQKHNGCVQFLSCENRANRLLYLFPGRLRAVFFSCSELADALNHLVTDRKPVVPRILVGCHTVRHILGRSCYHPAGTSKMIQPSAVRWQSGWPASRSYRLKRVCCAGERRY